MDPGGGGGEKKGGREGGEGTIAGAGAGAGAGGVTGGGGGAGGATGGGGGGGGGDEGERGIFPAFTHLSTSSSSSSLSSSSSSFLSKMAALVRFRRHVGLGDPPPSHPPSRPPSQPHHHHSHHAQQPSTPLFNSTLRPALRPYSGPVSVWTVELTDLKLVGDDDDNDIDVPEYDEMTVLFPVPGEDPFASDRKSMALDESFIYMPTPKTCKRGGSSTHDASHDHDNGTGQQQQKEEEEEEGGGEEEEQPFSQVVQNVHRVSQRSMLTRHAEAKAPPSQGLSMTVRAIVAPTFTRHLLIKLTDLKGRDIGQGVLLLPPPVPSSYPEEGPHIYVPLSLGAQPQPCLLSLRCRVTERPFVPPSQRGGGGRGGGGGGRS
ncbi:type ii inositol-trisphosphate 5-phosphatase [Nannochloropsis oceanica]